MHSLLDGEPVEAWLRRRGLVRPDQPVTVAPLAGGVSSLVVKATTPTRTLVLKQALPQLLVEQTWTADTVRLLHEARGLALAHELTPTRVPGVVDLDERARVLAIDCAPDGWVDWRSLLLAGHVDPRIGRLLGEALARWHRASAPRLAELTALLPAGDTCFDQLRVDPFYRFTATALPQLASRIDAVRQMLATDPTRTLVHGDFSPKNVLVAPANTDPLGCWVVDFEVAHVGAAAFDPAFLLTHLALKSLHRPADSERLHETATGFCAAYADGVGDALAPDWATVCAHVAVLILARVHGKSPAAYLAPATAVRATDLGTDLLGRLPHGVDSVDGLWRAIDRHQPGRHQPGRHQTDRPQEDARP